MRLKAARSMWRSQLNLAILSLFLCILSLPITSARPWTEGRLHRPGQPPRSRQLDILGSLRKRGCHLGLPCTYSHLSSIAAQRTLQRMMVDYIHNCVNDPRCSPGRRKRQTPSSERYDRLRSERSAKGRGLEVLSGR